MRNFDENSTPGLNALFHAKTKTNVKHNRQLKEACMILQVESNLSKASALLRSTARDGVGSQFVLHRAN